MAKLTRITRTASKLLISASALAAVIVTALVLMSLTGCANPEKNADSSAETPTLSPDAAHTDVPVTDTPTVKPTAEPTPKPTFAPAPESYSSGENRTVVKVPVGEGDGKIGYTVYDDPNYELERWGTDDFYIYDDTIFIADLDGNEILRFDLDGKYLGSDAVPDVSSGVYGIACDDVNYYLHCRSNGDFLMIVMNRETGKYKLVEYPEDLSEIDPNWGYYYAYGMYAINGHAVINIRIGTEPYGTLTYDSNGDSDRAVYTTDYGYDIDTSRDTVIIQSYDNGVNYTLKSSAILNKSEFEYVWGYHAFFLPDGSLIISGSLDGGKLYRIAKDGKLVAESDTWETAWTYGDPASPHRIPKSWLRVYNDRCYIMLQFEEYLEIREVAMHAVPEE